jgi:hypothetical protein
MQGLRRALVAASIACVSVLVLAVSAGAGPSRVAGTSVAGVVELTGTWRGDDNGIYWIREDRGVVWWGGVAPGPTSFRAGRRYTTVFRGKVQGSQITGTWADLPRGTRPLRTGELTLTIEGGPTPTLRRTGGTGPTRTWEKQ